MDVQELMAIIQRDDVLALRSALKQEIQYTENLKEENLVYKACLYNAENSALELIKQRKNFRTLTGNGTALMIACHRKQRRVVEKILSIDPIQLHKKNEEGMRPVHYAVCSGSTSLVEYLMEKGADIHQVDGYRNNLLHYAVNQNNNFEMVDYLLEKGVNPNLYDKDTPVVRALMEDKKDALKAFLKHYDKLDEENKELIKKERVRILFN